MKKFENNMEKQEKYCGENYTDRLNYCTVDMVENIEISGVDKRDYPDFCDAYISSATWQDNGRELTERELERLTENSPELIIEMATEKATQE